jgi:hypothetical protein
VVSETSYSHVIISSYYWLTENKVGLVHVIQEDDQSGPYVVSTPLRSSAVQAPGESELFTELTSGTDIKKLCHRKANNKTVCLVLWARKRMFQAGLVASLPNKRPDVRIPGV